MGAIGLTEVTIGHETINIQEMFSVFPVFLEALRVPAKLSLLISIQIHNNYVCLIYNFDYNVLVEATRFSIMTGR